jgi:arylformamidase
LTKDPFRNRDHVANFDALVEEYKVRSAETRAAANIVPDLAYGERASETLDLFLPKVSSGARPVHLFIHGGYWRMFSKNDFSFVADTITAAGAIAAIMDYDLMPEVRLNTIVGQAQNAVRWLAANIETYGGDPAQLSVSGHSAGAHLATFAFAEGAAVPGLKSALLLSGIYDLGPLQSSFLQPLIGLTEEEVTLFSPLRLRPDAGSNVTIAFGDRETDPFKTQGADFARHLAEHEVPATVHMLRDADHMTAVRDLGIPGSETAELLLRTILGSQSHA